MGTESSPPSSNGTAPAPSSCRTAASGRRRVPGAIVHRPGQVAGVRHPVRRAGRQHRSIKLEVVVGDEARQALRALADRRRASAQPAAAPGVGYGTPNERPPSPRRRPRPPAPPGRPTATRGRWSPGGGVAGGARGATAHHRHMRQIDLEAVRGAEGGHDRIGLSGADLGARPQSAQYTCPWSASGPTWNSSRPSAPWPCRTRPSSSSASRVRYTVDGMVCGSRSRQRSMSSALVTCPLLVASTSITVRRCGVQRIPRSWNCSRTPDHGSGSDADRLIVRSVYGRSSLLQ